MSAACSGLHGCDDKRPVPFKREAAEPTPSVAADSPPPVVAPPATAAGSSFPDLTREITALGSKLTRAEGSFRAALPLDLDADGQQDLLLLASDAQGRPLLQSAHREQGQWKLDATQLPLSTADDSCNLSSASLAPLSAESVLATLDGQCLPGPQSPWHQQLVISVEASPRVLLALRTRRGTAELPAQLSVALSSEDHDADEHPDVHATLQFTAPPLSAAGPLELWWLNRPSGLAPETGEPERTLATLADKALKQLTAKPLDALPLAEQALALHRALCREAGGAQLWCDGQAGLACGPSAAAGKAAAVRAIALAKTGQLLPALDALAALDEAALRVDATLRKRARRALGDMPGETDYIWQLGPALHPADSPNVRLPTLAFTDQEHLVLRGAIAQSYELSTHASSPTGASPSVLVVDEAGKLGVTDIVSRCDGDRLTITPIEQVVAGVVTGVGKSSAPVFAADSEAVAACAAAAGKRRDHGLSVLGMTAQGALVARGAALYLVPLTEPAATGSEPRQLSDTEPAPHLLVPGALSADGNRYALRTSEGVAIVVRGTSPTVSLVRPPASCTGPISDVALSPSGDRVAMICAGHVYVAQRPGSAAPSVPATGDPAVTPAEISPPPTAAAAPPPPVTALAPPEPEHAAEPQPAAEPKVPAPAPSPAPAPPPP